MAHAMKEFFGIFGIQDGRQMEYKVKRTVLCFSVCLWFILRDGWTYRAETGWDGRGHMQEQPHEVFFLFYKDIHEEEKALENQAMANI